MIDDEIYDPVINELRSISESMKELQKLVSQEISIANANNLLLRKLLEQQSGKRQEYTKSILDVNKYINQNLLILNSSKEESLEIAKKISGQTKGRLVVSEAKTDSEFAALINGLDDGDIVFVDVSEPTFDNKVARVLSECVKEQCINVPIGKGAGAKIVRLDIPKVYFIIYTYLEEFLPGDIKNLLMRVE